MILVKCTRKKKMHNCDICIFNDGKERSIKLHKHIPSWCPDKFGEE